MLSGAQSSALLILAPICVRGSTMRRMGRLRNCALPSTTLANDWPAISPASRRIVVPDELHKSGDAAARSPRRPTP